MSVGNSNNDKDNLYSLEYGNEMRRILIRRPTNIISVSFS